MGRFLHLRRLGTRGSRKPKDRSVRDLEGIRVKLGSKRTLGIDDCGTLGAEVRSSQKKPEEGAFTQPSRWSGAEERQTGNHYRLINSVMPAPGNYDGRLVENIIEPG